MKFTRRESTLYVRKRVPRRFAGVEEREYVWISLHTDSELVAQQKAPAVWAHMLDAWEAKLAGAGAAANQQLAAAKNLAAARGFRFLTAPEVAKLPTEELLQRIEAVVKPSGRIDAQEAQALLGGAPTPKLHVANALDEFWEISKDRIVGKSQDQIRRWENPRKKAFANFKKVVGNPLLSELTTADLMKFRVWLADLIVEGKLTENSANKDLVHLISTIKDVARANDISLKINTDRIMFKQGKANTRPPFSRAWIIDKLLAPGALDGLNAEARCIMLGMINTGYRPSEGAMLTSAQIRLDTDVPHIKIEAVGRTLKTDSSERVIPLVGVSLDAFRAFPNGFPRYADNPSLSDTINKFLRENKLLQTEGHSLYSLRHSFEDRLLAAGVDERLRMDLMGHQIKRERYGAGGDLEHLQRAVKLIAL
jgi:integrase